MTTHDGERRCFSGQWFEFRAGLRAPSGTPLSRSGEGAIIPADSSIFEDQRPRFGSWSAAEDWAAASGGVDDANIYLYRCAHEWAGGSCMKCGCPRGEGGLRTR